MELCLTWYEIPETATEFWFVQSPEGPTGSGGDGFQRDPERSLGTLRILFMTSEVTSSQRTQIR